MISREKQLMNPANILTKDGKVYIVSCMNCPDGGKYGKENYGIAVASGHCAWCGWNERDAQDYKSKRK